MVTDIVLIQAGEQLDVNMDSIYISSVEMIPLGILYLATVLKNYGYCVDVHDFSLYSNEKQFKLIDTIIKNKPRSIGISSSTTSFINALKYAEYIKERDPDIRIIMGGYHVTFRPNEALNSGFVDIVMRGESEDNIDSVLCCIINSKLTNLHNIKSISFIEKGKIFHNPPNINIIGELDSIPYPNRDLIDIKRYRNAGTIISSRGCVARCQFCAAGAFGKIRCRSSENVAHEVKEMYEKYGMNHIFFVDNTFSSDRRRAMDLFDKLNELGIKATYALESRVTEVDEDYIRFLKSNKVEAIQFGVESGNEAVLKSIKKHITLSQVRKAVSIAIHYKIRITCSFIIGHPADTLESVSDTISFAKELKRMGAMVVFGILTPYPGTEVYNNRIELGIQIEDWDYRKWDLGRAVSRNKTLSTKQIESLYFEANTEINII